MPEPAAIIAARDYLVSGVDAAGHRTFEHVPARTASEAVRAFRDRGFSDVTLHTDDVVDQGVTSAAARRTIRQHSSPERIAEINRRSMRGDRLWLVWNTYRPFVLPVVVACGWIALRRLRGAPWGVPDAILALVLLTPIIAIRIIGRAMATMVRIQREANAARWHRVLALSSVLERRIRPKLGSAAAALAAVEWRARALARLGRGDEALAAVEGLRKFPEIPEQTYRCHRAFVLMALRRYEDAAESYRQALVSKPDDLMAMIGLAEVLSSRLRRGAEARRVLEAARSMPATEQTGKTLRAVEGMVLLAEGRGAAARPLLEEALADLVRVGRVTPMAHGLAATFRAQLAIACAESGDREAGRRHWGDARPFLELHEDEQLIERCRRSVGA